jgi:hypothetical protein
VATLTEIRNAAIAESKPQPARLSQCGASIRTAYGTIPCNRVIAHAGHHKHKRACVERAR